MTQFLLLLHILGAATWLGANVALLFLGRRYSTTTGQVAAAHWRSSGAMGKLVQTPAAIVILITGIALIVTGDGGVGFGSTFVSIGFAVVIIGAILGMVVFGPKSEQAATLHEAGNTKEAATVVSRLFASATLDTALVVLAIAAMVGKWGA